MLMEPISLVHPYRSTPEPVPTIAGFDAAELRAALYLPHRMIDLVLGQRERLSRTVADGRHLGALAAILLLATVTLSLPYGAVLGPGRVWRVAVLLLGSVLICFPSLHVFSSYLGCRMSVGQNLVLALVTSSVASMFLLGFAPIAWFIRVTTPAGSPTTAGVAVGLLVAALLAGILRLSRSLASDDPLRPSESYRWLLLAWQGLFAYVAYRMGVYLGLP
jgi:hypothetical protein